MFSELLGRSNFDTVARLVAYAVPGGTAADRRVQAATLLSGLAKPIKDRILAINWEGVETPVLQAFLSKVEEVLDDLQVAAFLRALQRGIDEEETALLEQWALRFELADAFKDAPVDALVPAKKRLRNKPEIRDHTDHQRRYLYIEKACETYEGKASDFYPFLRAVFEQEDDPLSPQTIANITQAAKKLESHLQLCEEDWEIAQPRKTVVQSGAHSALAVIFLPEFAESPNSPSGVDDTPYDVSIRYRRPGENTYEPLFDDDRWVETKLNSLRVDDLTVFLQWFGDALTETLDKIAEMPDVDLNHLSIEFFLPFSDLNLPVHTWNPGHFGVQDPLFEQHSIVVRSLDRSRNPYVFRSMDARLESTFSVAWCPLPADDDEVWHLCGNNGCADASIPCVVFSHHLIINPDKAALRRGVKKGFPYMVWLSASDEDVSLDVRIDTKPHLEPLLKDIDSSEKLLKAVSEQRRRDRELGDRLVLMFESSYRPALPATSRADVISRPPTDQP